MKWVFIACGIVVFIILIMVNIKVITALKRQKNKVILLYVR
jgi:hypothetical protein